MSHIMYTQPRMVMQIRMFHSLYLAYTTSPLQPVFKLIFLEICAHKQECNFCRQWQGEKCGIRQNKEIKWKAWSSDLEASGPKDSVWELMKTSQKYLPLTELECQERLSPKYHCPIYYLSISPLASLGVLIRKYRSLGLRPLDENLNPQSKYRSLGLSTSGREP